MMETAGDSEKVVYFYETTRRHVAENRNFCSHHQEGCTTPMIGGQNLGAVYQ